VNHFLRSSYLRFLPVRYRQLPIARRTKISSCTARRMVLHLGMPSKLKSTGSGIGTQSPVFIVGGVANDVITFIMQPGTTSFITLQTRCGATASIKIA